MLLARAFQSEVESLFVEDRQLFDLAEFPVRARHLRRGGLAGAAAREPRARVPLRRCGAAAAGRRGGKRAEIPCRSRVVRDDPLHAVANCVRGERAVERRHHRRAVRRRRREAAGADLRRRRRHDGRRHRRAVGAAHARSRRRRRRAVRSARADAEGRRAARRRDGGRGQAHARRRPPRRAACARRPGAARCSPTATRPRSRRCSPRTPTSCRRRGRAPPQGRIPAGAVRRSGRVGGDEPAPARRRARVPAVSGAVRRTDAAVVSLLASIGSFNTEAN